MFLLSFNKSVSGGWFSPKHMFILLPPFANITKFALFFLAILSFGHLYLEDRSKVPAWHLSEYN